jgi:hypothetical protein
VNDEIVPGEVIETIEFSDRDKVDLAALNIAPEGDPDTTYHTILEAWREVLKPAAAEAKKNVTPQWANRMIATYMGLGYADMNDFRDLYYKRLQQMLDIAKLEIASDPDCLTKNDAAEDAAENSHHYKNLLMNWQLAILEWEMEWDCTSSDAAIEIGVISEIHKMFLSDQGLVAWLEQIKFEFTEADQEMLVQTLTEFKGEE